MAGHIFTLHTFPSRSRSTVLKSLAACHYTTKQRYSSQGSKGEHHGYIDIEERAPSMAKEFKRMAEKKVWPARQWTRHTTGQRKLPWVTLTSTVKNRYKEQEPGADYKTRPHDN